MAGKVPLLNAKFTNAPDFNYQEVVGITGDGVFRQFSSNDAGVNTWTVSSADAWSMILLTGNSLVTIPANIANIALGDEILFVNTTGTISFTTTGGAALLTSNLYTVYAERPARLIYMGSNNWILAGAKTSYSSSAVSDCCGTQQNVLYTLGQFSSATLAYSDAYGSTVYSFSGVGGVCDVGGTGYTIQSGIVTESPCALVDFDTAYTFYPNGSSTPVLLYSYAVIDEFDDNQIIGVPFKTSAVSGVYHCDDSFAANGTYYRYYDMYVPSLPVCFSAGVVVATYAC